MLSASGEPTIAALLDGEIAGVACSSSKASHFRSVVNLLHMREDKGFEGLLLIWGS